MSIMLENITFAFLPSSNDHQLDVLFSEERKRFVLEQLVTAPSSLRAAEAAALSDPRREGGAKIVPKLGGGAEEKAVSEAKLERRASSRTNPNQDTTGPCQAMGTYRVGRPLVPKVLFTFF